jgi:ribosomal protein S21|tara:strand:- start:2338 stop:2583 length:246 start_codon:yes stop_codon:yes gene_type:complete
MKKKANVIVKPYNSRESAEKMIRRFIKKTKKERIVEEVRERAHYKKPSIKKREKRERAQRAIFREEQKRLRAQQRRNRKIK